MYTNTHSSTGALMIILLPEFPVIAISVAFLSHFVVDAIGEHGYSCKAEKIETPFHIVFVVGCYLISMFNFYNHFELSIRFWEPQFYLFWWCMLGAFLANLPDLIDKGLMITLLKKPQILACHQKGWPEVFKFKTGNKTIWAGIVTMIFSFTVLIFYYVVTPTYLFK